MEPSIISCNGQKNGEEGDVINAVYELKSDHTTKAHISDNHRWRPTSSHAYVTLLSSEQFLWGTMVLMESLILSGTVHDIIVMVLPHISHHSRQRLNELGVIVMTIDYIDNPYPDLMVATRQRWNFSKLRAWQLVAYESIIVMDSDMLVLRNIDDLFEVQFPELAAVQNYDSPFTNSLNSSSVFNSGLMLINPSHSTFFRMLTQFDEIRSYNGGDQGFLNSFFTNWTRLSPAYNANKMVLKYSPGNFPDTGNLKVIHYVRKKPWYDKRNQFENHDASFLTDLPEDYLKLNNFWISANAFLNLRFTDKALLSESKYCIPVYGSKNDEKICVKVYPHFCPFTFTGQCRVQQEKALEEDITVVTHLSLDRFERLESIALEWDGPVSAALLVQPDQVYHTISKLLLTSLPMDRVDIHLVIQEQGEKFPINFLRNVALKYSITDMVLAIDVDFILAPLLHKRLHTMNRYASIWNTTYQKHAFVVPTFEFLKPYECLTFHHLDHWSPKSKACYTFPKDREDVVEQMDSGNISVFHSNGKGHRATDIMRWKTAQRPYYIRWEPWFEPYIIARRSQIPFPWFDERFYGRCKKTASTYKA